mmetsp:Transcript_46287/g.39001  ORF Transcript_46287/g.39001 Transcript_46287/m.39001 type:complete len:87 (+) Transcript_46287:348-608(+)
MARSLNLVRLPELDRHCGLVELVVAPTSHHPDGNGTGVLVSQSEREDLGGERGGSVAHPEEVLAPATQCADLARIRGGEVACQMII